jgi:acetyl esterase
MRAGTAASFAIGWLLLSCALLPAQEPHAISKGIAANCPAPVVGNPDGNYIVPGSMGDIPYKTSLTLDAYAPAGNPRPAALLIHGSRGDKRGYITSLYEQLTRDGYAWFAPNFKHADEDVAAALAYIRCPGRFNITDKIILIGDHTGAQTALKLASAGGVSGVVTVGGKVDEAVKTDVPVLMIHGTDDEQWALAKAQSFCGALKNCKLYPEDGARHFFENWAAAQWDYKEELDAWLIGDRRGLWKNIAYLRPSGRDLAMDAFIPQGVGPFPAVIVIHGGGFARDKVTYIAPIFEPLAKAGIAWFSIDYTPLPYVHLPDVHDQVRAAIRYIRKHAARYHVDPDRLALMGESFSAPVATVVASKPCSGCEVQAVLSFYGNYRVNPPQDAAARTRLDTLYGSGAWNSETLRDFAPYDLAHTGMPPVLVIQGTAEQGGPERSREYCDHLKQLGVRTELVIVEGAPHGIENWEEHPEWAFYKTKVVDWLKAAWH